MSNHKTGDALYRNDGNDNHWLRIKPVGTRSNRDAVGARITVKAGDLSMLREINGGTSRAQRSMIAHLGLGQNTQVDSIEIRWPFGTVTTLTDVPADQMIEVTEGVDGYKTLHTGEGMEQVVEPSGKLPSTWGKAKVSKLYQNFPNPFNPETWIPYQLAQDSSVVIRIHTPSGQLVRTLDLGDEPAGLYTEKTKAAHWDGTNEAGEPVASGVYFYTIQTAEDYTATRKMVIAR